MHRVTLPLICMLLIATTSSGAEPSVSQVLFVCEHGNVKSLMATSYFNRLAQERGLPFRAVSRGTAPDSTTVPAPIIAGLRVDGFDVAGFVPTAVSEADVSASRHIVTISTTLPAKMKAEAVPIEQWDDVPAASADFGAARDSLKVHIDKLVEELQRRKH